MSDEPSIPTGNNDGGVADGGSSDGSPSNDGAPLGDGATGTIDVNGTLTGRAVVGGGPLASRDVVVIDANGVVTKTSSGADGTFHVAGVKTPYDVAVPYIPVSPDMHSSPRYYAGITRVDPVVSGIDYNPSYLTTRSANITFTVCSNCNLWMSGPDDSHFDFGTGVSQTIKYTWHGDSTRTIDLHFYFQQSQTQSVPFTAHVDKASVALADGQTVALGDLGAGTPIPTNTSTTFTATLPALYTYSGADVRFYGADDSSIAYQQWDELSSTVLIPPVATLRVTAGGTSLGPSGEHAYWSVGYAAATSVPTAISASVLPAPVLLTPSNHAVGVPSSQVLSWSAFGAPSSYQVYLAETNGVELLAYTSSTSFDMTRLGLAGIVLASGHTYSWQAITDEHKSIDDLVTSTAPPAVDGVVRYAAHSSSQSFTAQ